MLSKREVVCRINLGNSTEEQVAFTGELVVVRHGCKSYETTDIQISQPDWVSMDRPLAITVTIRPGDELNG